MSTGAVVSLTVTVNEAELVLPRVSLAVQVTVVVPSGKIEPLARVHVTGRTPSTASIAVAVYVNAAPEGPVASTVALAGTVITGGAVSAFSTVTSIDDAVDRFRASNARAVSVTSPLGTAAVSQLTT